MHRNKSSLEISAEGGVSPSWEGGAVPSPTLRRPGEMLGGASPPLRSFPPEQLTGPCPGPTMGAKRALEARQQAVLSPQESSAHSKEPYLQIKPVLGSTTHTAEPLYSTSMCRILLQMHWQ